MIQVVKAIYEDGVFRPLEPLDIPDRSEVEITIQAPHTPADASSLSARGRSFVGIGRSGRRDVSERAEELLRAGFGR